MNVAPLPAALAVVLWGLSFVATKMALAELSPMAVVIAGLRGRSLRPPVGLWPRLLLAGFLGVFLHMLLQTWGLTMTTAVRTGWLIGIIPVWSALLALVVLGEGLGRRVRVCSCWLVPILCKRRIHDAGGRTGGFGRHEVSGRVAP